MKLRFLIILFCSCLSACVYYGDIQSNSKPLTVAKLNQPYIYQFNKTISTSIGTHWWLALHNAELNQLIVMALRDSPNIAIANARVRKAQQEAAGVATLLWPTADLNGYLCSVKIL